MEEILDFTNHLAGEPVIMDCATTELSGGQTRAFWMPTPESSTMRRPYKLEAVSKQTKIDACVPLR